jgi:hypothetical protein
MIYDLEGASLLLQSHLAKAMRIPKETPEKEKAAEELPLANSQYFLDSTGADRQVSSRTICRVVLR